MIAQQRLNYFLNILLNHYEQTDYLSYSKGKELLKETTASQEAESERTAESSVGGSESALESLGQEIVDHVGNITQSQDEHVLMVKNGYPMAYPNCLYGEVFDEFFASPTWVYFQGDGGENVVEFTGICTYMDVEVKARLQFILNMEEETFETGALSFNDVPQNNLITYALIQKAFEEYAEANGIELPDDDSLWDYDEDDESYYGDAEADEYILPYSDCLYYTAEDLRSLTPEELRIARNEIYARYGCIFKSEDLQEYFNSKSWYYGTMPVSDFDDSWLNQYEKANRDLIVAIEAK